MKLNLGYLVLFTVVASSISNIVFQDKANAWVDICNKGSTRIEKLAVAYIINAESEYPDLKTTGTDRWSMNPGECRRIYDAELIGPQIFYYYIEGKGWAARPVKELCIATDRDFEFYKHTFDKSGCGGVVTFNSEYRYTINGNDPHRDVTKYNTKLAKFGLFSTSGRNHTLNVTN
jgi:uncharacterized membrane protein